MQSSHEIRLAELLAAISLATDLGRGFPPEKALRTCLIAERIGLELGLDDRARSDMYYAALIHAVGCTSFTYEAAINFGTNELVSIPAYAQADKSRPSEAMRAMRTEVSGEPVSVRARAMFKNLATGKKFMSFAARADCEAGANFTRRIGLGEDVAKIAAQAIWERWDGKGVPDQLQGEELELGARIIALAHQVEIFHRMDGPGDARSAARRRAGGWLDPAVVQAFESCADSVFAELDAGSVWDSVLELEPGRPVVLPERRVDELCSALADMVDLKSPYLLGHSSGVARLAEAACGHQGLSPDECTAVRRAGLLHDIGRVGVPNRVWDKPGALTSSEWEQVRLHAYNTERILASTSLLAPLAQTAGMHHERIDGSGYHRAAMARGIPKKARILAAADVFNALTEPRPHRAAMAPDDAAKEVEDMVAAGALDPDAARAVCECAGVALKRRRKSRRRPAGLTEREIDVLRLLARGFSEKQIAEALNIAQGTVHTHKTHIYEKVGASTRAGVALFAMEHGLVEA